MRRVVMEVHAARARADLDLAERALRARTPLLEAVWIILAAARETAALVSVDHPAREALMARYQAVREQMLSATVDQSGEVRV